MEEERNTQVLYRSTTWVDCHGNERTGVYFCWLLRDDCVLAYLDSLEISQ